MFLDLIHNITLLVALALGLQVLAQSIHTRGAVFCLAVGAIFGLVGILGMMTPMRFAPGVIYDGRSIILSLAGVVAGPLGGGLAALICGAYRLALGGAGVVVGTATVVESAALGVVFYYLRRRNPRWTHPLGLLAFGFAVHVGMLGLQLFLPAGMGWAVLARVGPVVLVAFPAAFLLLAHVFLEGERKREAKGENRRYVRRIIETTADGFWVIDKQGRLVDVNEAYCRMVGYRRAEVLKMSVNDLDVVETREDTLAHIEKVMTEGSDLFETRQRRKNGEEFPLEVSASYWDEGGGRLVCFGRDLTERKRREERISLMSQMLDDAPASITIHDTDGRFVFANRATLAMHGYESVEEFVRVNLHDLDVPESEAKLAERFRLIEETGEARFEVEHYRKDGTTFPLEILAKLIEWNGAPAILSIATDISERRRAESALRESEAKWRNVLVKTPQIGVSIDPQGRIAFANERFLELTGWQADEILGRDWFDTCLPQEVREEVRGVFRQVMAQGAAEALSAYENEIVTRSGERLNVAWANSVTKDETGAILDVTCLGVDLTERRNYEKTLQYQLGLITSLLNSIPDIVFYKNADGVYLGCNPEFARHVGRTVEEIVGKTDYDLYDKDEADAFRENDRLTMERGAPRNNEEWIAYPDGRRVLLDTLKAPLRTSAGQPIGIVGICRDITERKEAEAELAERQRMLSTILNSVDSLIMVADRDLRVIHSNWRDHEWVPESRRSTQPHCFEVFKEFDKPCAHCPVLKTFEDGEARWYEDCNPLDGTYKEISVIPIFNERGQVEYVLENVRDVTERKEAEREREQLNEQLAQSRKMESIGRLAGGVAHDFNNMLNVIIGHAELALGELPQDSEMRPDLQQILNAAERSADLTRQLLAFARRQTLQLRDVMLNDVVESMLKMLRRLIGEDIDLVWKPGHVPWAVRIDPTQIDQVVANLVVNARDAIGGEREGTIAIETDMSECNAEQCAGHPGCAPGAYALVTIRDDGCGMDEETLARIFEPFYTTKGVGEGTGLGLATVYGVVRQNNGMVEVESAPGKGTAFHIYLPLSPERAAEGEQAPDASPEALRGDETILLVEDEPSILSVGRKILEHLGYRVVAASRAADALAAAEREDGMIDLLLTDVVMPGMNGRELAERLCEKCANLRCVYMSGYPAEVMAHKGILDDGMLFLQKPFTMESLSRMVRRALDEM